MSIITLNTTDPSQADLQLDSLLEHAFNTHGTTLTRAPLCKLLSLGDAYDDTYDAILDDCQLYAQLKRDLSPVDFLLLQNTYTFTLTTDHIDSVYRDLLPIISRYTDHGDLHVPARFCTVAILAELQQNNLLSVARQEIPDDLMDHFTDYKRVYQSYREVTHQWVDQAKHAAKLAIFGRITGSVQDA